MKDLQVSHEFYEKLGFEVFAGKPEHRYYIMKSRDTLIGLFQGMFQGNLLTFNPGWDQNAQIQDNFMDVREIQTHLKEKGVELIREADKPEGPASFVVKDPDGNVILVDQHVG